jgi:EAL domain-containing protein (putative c-di-GMP-specific phosphodiesterase class I)
MTTRVPPSFAAFAAEGQAANPDLELLCELFDGSDREVCLEVDGRRVTMPPSVREVLERVVDHLRRGGDIRRSLAEVPAAAMLQPVVELRSGAVAGYEALCDLPTRGLPATERWLRDGARFGLVEPFEIGAVELALETLGRLPETAYLSINVSPSTVTSGELTDVLGDAPLERLVLELTEHAPVDNYLSLENALAGLRSRGLRVAVDDAGAGFASFRHILRIHPEMVKLDRSLSRGIDNDAGRRSLVSALVGFTGQTGAVTVAEGVESAAQAACLAGLGVSHGQGWYFGAPRRA